MRGKKSLGLQISKNSSYAYANGLERGGRLELVLALTYLLPQALPHKLFPFQQNQQNFSSSILSGCGWTHLPAHTETKNRNVGKTYSIITEDDVRK